MSTLTNKLDQFNDSNKKVYLSLGVLFISHNMISVQDQVTQLSNLLTDSNVGSSEDSKISPSMKQ